MTTLHEEIQDALEILANAQALAATAERRLRALAQQLHAEETGDPSLAPPPPPPIDELSRARARQALRRLGIQEDDGKSPR